MANPMLVTPGQSVGQGDWEALFAQHGGFKSVQNRTPTKEEQAAADDAGVDLVQHPIYRYYLADGTFVEAQTAANGADYQIVEYKPSQKFQQEQTQQTQATTPATQRTAREEAEIKKNASLPGPNPNGATEAERRGQDPRAETDAERAARADATIKQQGADARQAQIDADAKAERERVAARQAKADADAAAEKNKPVVTLTQNGTQAVITYPDGRVETKPTGLAEPPKAGQVVKGAGANGEDVQAIADPKTGVISYQPIPGATAPSTKMPPNVRAPAFSRGNVAGELARFWQELEAARASGAITNQQAIDLYSPYHTQGQTFLSEQTAGDTQASGAIGQQLTQRGQDITQADSRLGFTTNAFTNAANVDKNYLLGAAKTGRSLIVPLMDYQRSQALGMGGLNTPAPVSIPRYDQQRPPGSTGIAAVDNAPGFVPPGQPNALGVGAVGDTPAPTAIRPLLGPPAPATNIQPAPAAPAADPVGATAAAAAPAASTPTVTYRDQWGNTFTVPKADFDARPGGNADVTVVSAAAPAAPALPQINQATGEPTGLPQASAPSGYRAIDMATSPPGTAMTIDDTSQQLIDAGYPPELVAEARRRHLTRQGVAMG